MLTVVLCSCKTTKKLTETDISENKITFSNSLNISLNSSNNQFPIQKTLANKLSEELIFKDIAPSYYMHTESIFDIPKNIKRITSTTKYDLYEYYFDRKGRLDSLYSTRNGSYKIIYNTKNGLIDYIKNTKTYSGSKKIKTTEYLTYFATGKDIIAKYVTEKKDLELSIDEFEDKFTYNNQGEIIKTNYNKVLNGNYIEYYTFTENKSNIKLIKVKVHTYFFIKGYKLDKNGQILDTYFTNDDMDLKSNKFKSNTNIVLNHPYFEREYDTNKRILTIINKEVKHTYEYYK